MNKAERPALLLVPIGLALIGIDLVALRLHIPGQLGIGSDQRLRVFVWLMLIEAVLYAGAVLIVLRCPLPKGALALILCAAFAMRGLLLFSPPFLSTDLYRYVWDGMVQKAGINPYRYRPDAEELRFLRDRRIYPGINRKTTARTIYPPFAEAVFAVAARLSPTLTGMKAVMTVFDLVAIWALLALLKEAGLPMERILIYAWQPLPVFAFAGNGHVDAIVCALLALALLLAARGRNAASAVAFALSVLAKLIPLVVAPALWRPRGWRFPAIVVAMIALFYAAYASGGKHLLGFLPGYVYQEGIASGLGIFWLEALSRLVPLPALAGSIYLAAMALVLIAAGLLVWRRELPPSPALRARSVARDAGWLGVLFMLVLTPHYAWYFAWLLVPLTVAPGAALYLPAAAFLLYLDPIHVHPLWPALLYFPFLAVLALELLWKRRHRASGSLIPGTAR